MRTEVSWYGTSGDDEGICDEDPMCMHTIAPTSSHARRKGSHHLRRS